MGVWSYVIGIGLLLAGAGTLSKCSYDAGEASCEAKQQKADNVVLEQHVQQAGTDAKSADQATADHQQKERDNGAEHAKEKEQIRYIHDKAPPSDCLRQPVDPALDQRLRRGHARADHPPGGDAAEQLHGS